MSNHLEDSHTDVVVIGRINGAYGVHGWVRLTSHTDPIDNILAYSPWLLQEGSTWSLITPQEVKPHKAGFVAKLETIGDRDAAQALAGRTIAVDAAVLPEPASDEYYWRDLIGLEVKDVEGRKLGKVEQLLETGANDVLVVRETGGGERLIPFLAQFVPEVDLEAGHLVVDWEMQ